MLPTILPSKGPHRNGFVLCHRTDCQFGCVSLRGVFCSWAVICGAAIAIVYAGKLLEIGVAAVVVVCEWNFCFQTLIYATSLVDPASSDMLV